MLNMDLFTGMVILAVGVALGAGGVAAWFLARRGSALAELSNARARADMLDNQVQQRLSEIEQLRAKNDGIDRLRETAERQAAVIHREMQSKQQHFDEQRRLLDDARNILKDTFRAVGGEALAANNEQFLQLAEQKLGPLKTLLEQHQQMTAAIEQKRDTAYGSVLQQVQLMVASNDSLRKETNRLVTALRRPEVRGRWGEMQLRRVAEMTGMIDRCDFTEQSVLESADGRLRPDMLVHLPNNGTIAVDAKTPLDAVLDALQSEDEHQRDLCLDRFVNHVETQIRALSGKQYWAALDRSPDFVILFIPGESFLQAAAQKRTDLLEAAMAKGVVIATPNTLFSLLKVVALGWREQALTENAQHISELGIELHERLCVALGHALSLGKSLNASVEHYQSFVSSVESRVLVTGRRLEELGAKSKKDLPDVLPDVVTIARLPTQTPLVNPADGLPLSRSS